MWVSSTCSFAESLTLSYSRSLQLSVMELKGLGAKIALPYSIVSLNDVKQARTPAVAVKAQSAFWGEEFTFEYVY